ncbi:CADM3 [Mytilus coruscus]|uniref:CADM3 n=1 Tax=Mytilus coruscus TaxID=42192 RepID=A0A6J8BU41_MYTCO|nr:CADM3 [Mytilus coruscus]
MKKGILALKVTITQNITGFVGKKDTRLTCSFNVEKYQSLISVSITAKNEADKYATYTPIAVFKPQQAAVLTIPGDYLFGRVTLTNVTNLFIDAAIRFDTLECIDEKDYMCIYNYFDKNDAVKKERSEPTRILIKASSTKPDSISSFKVSSKSDTITNRQLNPDANSLLFLREGETVMFTCTGNIGKPPGKFIWQKTSPLQKEAVIYHTKTTVKEEMPKICSLKGTSDLTLQISANDLNAKIRCFEESQADVPGMFIETSLLDVQCEYDLLLLSVPVKHVNINKQPNKKRHERLMDNIILTCEGSGNPEPTYLWFKQDNKKKILSRTNLYVINDVIRNNTGVYICEASNIIDNVQYRKYNSVNIDIVHATYAIPVTCAVVIVVVFLAVRKSNCKRHKKNVPDDTVIYSEVNEQTKLKYRWRKNLTTAVQPDDVQHDSTDGAEEVARDPTLKYNMITGKLLYTDV